MYPNDPYGQNAGAGSNPPFAQNGYQQQPYAQPQPYADPQVYGQQQYSSQQQFQQQFQQPNPQQPNPKPNVVAMVISYILSGLGSVVLFISVVLFVAFMVPQLFGVRPYAVLTGSMEPDLPVGCLVYSQEVDPTDLKVDDVITFDKSVPGQGSSVVTHRIVQINPDDMEFVTKGDANESNDPQPVVYNSVIGKVVFSMPLIGYMAMTVDSFNGKIAMIAIIFGAMILCLVGDQIRRSARRAARRKAGIA